MILGSAEQKLLQSLEHFSRPILPGSIHDGFGKKLETLRT